MKVIPGSHLGADLPHRDTFADDNALARGQEIAVEVDEAQAVPLVLEPGEMSIHHIGVVHGSEPNRSDEARIGVAVRFVAPEVRQDVEKAMAVLARGEDRFGNFDLLAAPTDSSPAAVEQRLRAEIVERMYGNLMPPQTVGVTPEEGSRLAALDEVELAFGEAEELLPVVAALVAAAEAALAVEEPRQSTAVRGWWPPAPTRTRTTRSSRAAGVEGAATGRSPASRSG